MKQDILDVGNWVFSGFWHFVGVWLLFKAFAPFRFNFIHEYKTSKKLEDILKGSKE